MKKLLFILPLVALFASCQKETVVDSPIGTWQVYQFQEKESNSIGQSMTYTIAVPDSINMKFAFFENGTFVFSQDKAMMFKSPLKNISSTNTYSSQSGTYSYDNTTKRLTLIPEGSSATVFEVLTLDTKNFIFEIKEVSTSGTVTTTHEMIYYTKKI